MDEERKLRGLTGERLAWVIVGGFVALHVLLAVLLFDPKPFVGGDNAGYMILAESIETGQGYRDIHLPGTPRHAQYPPVYPAVLAAVRALGGGLIAFKFFSLIFTSAALVFLFSLARRRLDLAGSVAVVAPLALSPVLLYYSHWVLSEALFVVLSLIALWASERMLDSWRWLAVFLGFAFLAYLTRAAGMPLLAATLVVLAVRRRWRQLAAAAGAVAVVVGGWGAWGKMAASESAQVYTNNFLLVDPYQPELGYVGPGELLARAVNNVRLYSVEVLPESLAGASPGGGVGLFALLAALLLIALALVAWVRAVRKPQVLDLFTAFYLALIFLWPEAWTDRRFLLPLLPVLLLYAAAGVLWCMEFLRIERRVWALPALAALLVLLALPGQVRSVGYNQRCMRFYRQGDRLACYPAPWRAFAGIADWVGANTPDDAIVVNRKPRLFYYFARRRGDVYPFTTDDSEMLAFLDRIEADYVVVVPISRTTYRYLVPVIVAMPERFPIVHQMGDSSAPSYVLRYHSSGAAGEPPEGS